MRKIIKSLALEYVDGHSKQFRETSVLQLQSRRIDALPVPKEGRCAAVLSDEALNDFAREQLIGVGEGWLGKFSVSSSEDFHHRRGIIEETTDGLPFA
jgi:hypothetical protein